MGWLDLVDSEKHSLFGWFHWALSNTSLLMLGTALSVINNVLSNSNTVQLL